MKTSQNEKRSFLRRIFTRTTWRICTTTSTCESVRHGRSVWPRHKQSSGRRACLSQNCRYMVIICQIRYKNSNSGTVTLDVVLIFIQFHSKCCFPQSTRNKMDSQQHLQLWLWWKLRPCVSANFISHFWDFSLAAIFGTLTFLSHQYFELEYSSGTNIQLKQDAKVPAERSASPKRIFWRKKITQNLGKESDEGFFLQKPRKS